MTKKKYKFSVGQEVCLIGNKSTHGTVLSLHESGGYLVYWNTEENDCKSVYREEYLELKQLEFFIPGSVTPKARPRVTKNGAYLPKRYKDWRLKAQDELLVQLLKLQTDIKFPIEKAAVSLKFTGKHRTNSDLDNLAGACLDALTLNGAGIIKDDNLNCLPKLNIEFLPDAKQTGVWILIEKLKVEKK